MNVITNCCQVMNLIILEIRAAVQIPGHPSERLAGPCQLTHTLTHTHTTPLTPHTHTQGESVAGIGYRLELGGLTMKGKVDSHGVVSAVLEKRLDPIPATLLLSGQLNHWTDDSRFGISIMVG